MRPKRPLPTAPPFMTFFTNTYRRPAGLTANMKSVHQQTAVEAVEQIIVPDYLGHSPADAVYGRMPWYAETPRGEYVHVLGDDDVLASVDVVAKVQKFAAAHGHPPVIVVRCRKGDTEYPKCGLAGAPVEGDIDLCCFVMRRDVWVRMIATYCPRYKCDWDGFLALRQVAEDACADAPPLVSYDLLFAIGKVGGGRPEEDW